MSSAAAVIEVRLHCHRMTVRSRVERLRRWLHRPNDVSRIGRPADRVSVAPGLKGSGNGCQSKRRGMPHGPSKTSRKPFASAVRPVTSAAHPVELHQTLLCNSPPRTCSLRQGSKATWCHLIKQVNHRYTETVCEGMDHRQSWIRPACLDTTQIRTKQPATVGQILLRHRGCGSQLPDPVSELTLV